VAVTEREPIPDRWEAGAEDDSGNTSWHAGADSTAAGRTKPARIFPFVANPGVNRHLSSRGRILTARCRSGSATMYFIDNFVTGCHYIFCELF